MSKGKKISALVAATAIALSTVGYFPATTAYATNESCAANPVTLTTDDLQSLATDGKYQLTGDTTGDLNLNPAWGTNPSIEIDLNGCTLDGRIAANGGTVTITDSSAEQTGTVTGGSHRAAAQTGQYGGNIVINGGNFEKPVNQQNQWSNVSISGGTFIANDARFVDGHLADGYSRFTMDDGRNVVEQPLTEDNVTFPEDVEMTEGESQDFIVVVEPDSKVLHVDYTPVSNDNFEIANGKITAKSVGDTEVEITVSQGETEVAKKTVSVKVNPALEWARIKNWQENENTPSDGYCMGYHYMMPGDVFELETETNLTDRDAEISIEMVPDYGYEGTGAVIDPTVPVATLSDDQKTLTAENTGYVRLNVTATYGDTTVTSHGHVYVGWVKHEVVEGDGDEYQNADLTQKIDAEMSKLREIYICPVSIQEAFFEKYGEDSREWSEEAWQEYSQIREICETLLDEAYYTVESGSTIVTFLSDWLATLEPGTYDVFYNYTDGFAEATFVIPEKKNEVVIALAETNSVVVADTGVMTAPVAEGVRSTLGATIAATVATTVAAAVVVFAKRKTRK